MGCALLVAGCNQPAGPGKPRTARERLEKHEAPARERQVEKTRGLVKRVREVEEKLGLEGVAVRGLADAVLAELKALALSGETKTLDTRRVIFLLESLVNVGPDAVLPIGAFLEENKDIEYGITGPTYRYVSNQSKPAGEGQSKKVQWSYNGRAQYTMNTEFALPVSLRMGLFEVLARIGDGHAEGALLRALDTTARGIEVATLDRLLEEMSGPKYSDKVLTVTHDLLADPPKVAGPGKLDYYNRKYLFGLLTKYKDETFVEVAQYLIVREDGRVDTDVVGYLNRTLGARAVPVLAAACQDERLDPRYVSTLTYHVLRYVGTDAGAEAMFRKIMEETGLASLRRNAISNLAYNNGTKEATQRKLTLLQAYKDKFADDTKLKGTIKWVEQRLQQRLNPQSQPSPRSGGVQRLQGAVEGALWNTLVEQAVEPGAAGDVRVFRLDSGSINAVPGGVTIRGLTVRPRFERK